MRQERLETMVRGWFVGNFDPTLYRTSAVEIAVRNYKADDYEEWHYHGIATEITVFVSGEAEMNGNRFGAGDIIVINPGEGTDFRALTDVVSVVVKIPGVNNDKYARGGNHA
jgi:mannose-6-phosphate isomerase-like protein (cupin superfamily)